MCADTPDSTEAGTIDLVPPVELILDGTTSAEEFRNVGEGFVRHFIVERAGLKPEERVLDVGCGIGKMARALTGYLRSPGSYDGFDIGPDAIKWCQDRYKPFGNFRFVLADIFNTHYRREGRWKASEYVFPYEDSSFDVVFLASVFTHLLPDEVENYLGEVSRVLAPGGRCVITFFLLNEESKRRIRQGRHTIEFPYGHESGHCRLADEKVPEMAVAYEESFARDLHERLGLTAVEVSYGFWCGRQELHGCFQDAIIALKEDQSSPAGAKPKRGIASSIRRALRWRRRRAHSFPGDASPRRSEGSCTTTRHSPARSATP